MTSGSALFDTNILIDLFSGRREAVSIHQDGVDGISSAGMG